MRKKIQLKVNKLLWNFTNCQRYGKKDFARITFVEDIKKIGDNVKEKLENASIESKQTSNDIVSDIAEQTNLLALNTAIEAACAGEIRSCC